MLLTESATAFLRIGSSLKIPYRVHEIFKSLEYAAEITSMIAELTKRLVVADE